MKSVIVCLLVRRSPGWHMLRVRMVGDYIECHYDGKKYLDVKGFDIHRRWKNRPLDEGGRAHLL